MAFDWLLDSIARIQALSEELKLPIYIDRFPPVPEIVIDAWEQAIGIPFSSSHRDFFRITNGLTIDYRFVTKDECNNFELEGSQLWILPIEQIHVTTEYEKSTYDNTSDSAVERWEQYMVCGRSGYTETIIVLDTLSNNMEYSVCYAGTATWPGHWRHKLVLASSFEEWIKTMLESILERRAQPEYWNGQSFLPPEGPDRLLADGAELYDWTRTSKVIDGVPLPLEPEHHMPLSSNDYHMGVVQALYARPKYATSQTMRLHVSFTAKKPEVDN